MDKSNAYEKFTGYVDQLRNTECSQKQKIACFQQIAECIMSPALAAHINYAAHCGTATNVLLLFCEDFDSVVRMSAEENLNKIFRALEKTRVSRILMDLYGEIKRNGNQRSLRICLNLFSYYAPQIKEKHIKWYAVRLLQCISIMSQRKETQLQETLCDFVKHFGRHVQQGLNDSETCKLFETFLDNISADCAVKRRCSAQNCMTLIEHARNRSLMARHGLNKVIETLLMDQQTSCVLGSLGVLRLLLPQLIRGYAADYQDDGDSLTDAGQPVAATSDCRQIIEIYDYCLHLLSTQHTANHAIINGALEVINAILQALQDSCGAAMQLVEGGKSGLAESLRKLLCNQQLEHNEYLWRRKSLKNQIFQLRNYEVVGTSEKQGMPLRQMQMEKNLKSKLHQKKCQQKQQQLQIGISPLHVVGINAVLDDADTEKDAVAAANSAPDEVKKTARHHIRNAARSISECVGSSASDDEELLQHEQTVDVEDDDDDDDGEDDMELLTAIADDEYEGFTTLSQLNEAQQTMPAALKDSNTTGVIAATIVAQTGSEYSGEQSRKPSAVQHQSSLQNLLASDDRSQHLSDIDNESFNSIDFDAEITIAGVREEQTPAATHSAPESTGSMPDVTTIGTFFNNLLSHSHSASESVSKLFRQSSGPKSTPIKSAPATDKSDAASTASLTLSLSSLASSNVAGISERQISITETPTPVEQMSGSASASASYTPSTALLMDTPADAATPMKADEEMEPQMRRMPNANPFLAESSPLKQTVSGRAVISVKIGSILEQPLLYYTSRLLAARFLLRGQASTLQPDSVSRVSIKSLSLAGIAQCVRLSPRVLQLPLEISDQELELLAEVSCAPSAESTQASSPQSSNNSKQNTELLQSTTGSLLEAEIGDGDNELMLDIKDDHFGPSTCPAYLQQPSQLSRSADAALLQRQLEVTHNQNQQPPSAVDGQLSRSEIIGGSYRITIAAEDAPPLALPPLPPKRTKSMRCRTSTSISMPTDKLTSATGGQALSDVLLFYSHCDPILRGGVQQIVGNFVQSSRAGSCLQLQRGLDLSHLLAILLKGFEDEIHTVVIQALNAFDKIFPHVVSKYLTAPPCHYHAHQKRQQLQQPSGQQWSPGHCKTFGPQTFAKNLDNALSSQQHEQQQEQQQWHSNDDNSSTDETKICVRSSTTDNDEMLAALLNDFELQSNRIQQHTQQQHQSNKSVQYNEPGPCCVFAISPKLLLSKLRICRQNKYWLVQNKYAEVISNLNYVLLRAYYANFDCASDNNNNNKHNDDVKKPKDQCQGAPNACNWIPGTYNNDIAHTYEAELMDELLQLLGDDDARVREHAAFCLCRFIMQTGRQMEQLSTTAAAAATATTTQQTNFNLLWDFFDYRIFGSMSLTFRNLFRPSSTIAPPMTALDGGEYGHGPYAGTTEAGTIGGVTIEGAAAAASAYFDGSYGLGIADGHVFASGFQRQVAQEEKVLAKVLYRMTNKLMTLDDKNVQYGIISALRLLLKHFNFVDYRQAWMEFNFIEICMSYAYYNSATAGDLNCQHDLIDVIAKLIAGSKLSSGDVLATAQLDFLLRHCVKLLNIYYHLVGNQRPVQSSSTSKTYKAGKSELFTLNSSGSGEHTVLTAMGYFASDYVYMKLYNILRGANDSYKITINHDSGGLLISLLKSCLNALSLCLEASAPPVTGVLGASNAPALKLIEEILQYLTKLINYAPGECVACLRQLLKYLFGQNFAGQVQREVAVNHDSFVRQYFEAKRAGGASTLLPAASVSLGVTTTTTTATPTTTTIEEPPTLGSLFVQGMQAEVPPASDCVRLIKLFEPLVIYCLTLFMKSNALIQAPILMLLSQLLDLNVTYSILDSKSVIFEQILNNLDLIESGIDRNAPIIVPAMVKFLMQLTHKSDRQLITIPKIISITNNLLANGAVRNGALLALKTLSYELFFMHNPIDEALNLNAAQQRASCQSPLTAVPTQETKQVLLAQRRELDTQKEVVLGMLEKFIGARTVQQLLALVLLYERSLQQLDAPTYLSSQDANVIYDLVCRSLATGQLRVHTFGDLRLLESCFRNNGNYVLADIKGFLQLLQLFIEQDVGNFSDLALAMITLENVILKTEEIYLVNHIKLYLKNNPTAERRLRATATAEAATKATTTLQLQDEAPSTSSAAAAARASAFKKNASPLIISEINYFAKVLSEKLLDCLDALLALGAGCNLGSSTASHAYCQLARRFVNALHNVCCRSRHKDSLQSVFRLVLAESEFLCKYYNLLLMTADVEGVAGSETLEPVLLACLQLLLSMRLMDPTVLLAQASELPLKLGLHRAMLHEVCHGNAVVDLSPQQVRRLCARKYLNFLIADHLEFLCELCQVRPECGSLLQAALLRNAPYLKKHSIRRVLRLLYRICETQVEHSAGDSNNYATCTLQSLQLLSRLHQLHDGQRAMQLPMERLARRLFAQSTPTTRSDIYDRLMHGELAGDEDQDELRTMLLKDLEWPNDNGTAAPPRIIDEDWLFTQVIKFATQHADASQQQQQLMWLLLEIPSEAKLQHLFRSLGPVQEARLLRHALDGSLTSMVAAFRQKCIQHAPHINYMQLPPLARVACTSLMSRLAKNQDMEKKVGGDFEKLDVARALTTLLVSIGRLEQTALIYIDAKHIEKFVAEHLLRPEQLPTLLSYMRWLTSAAVQLLKAGFSADVGQDGLGVLLGCLDAMLQQPRIWGAINSSTDALRVELLEVPVLAARHMLQDTIFYHRHRLQSTEPASQAIFLAKLIETQIDIESLHNGKVLTVNEFSRLQFAGHELAPVQVPLTLIASIGTSLLRTHQLYAYAVTPYELIQQQQQQATTATGDGKLPPIPVDSLSDVDVLRQFVKRLSIFGYTTRQQFEEYFMTFLLLINKLYDEHMVDQQEQFQIKQLCLQAIMELLTTYTTFPFLGHGNSQFYHTTRWQRINCDSISLKKLHKVQLLVDTCNVFYLANLERQPREDNVIGTCNFTVNQCDLDFSWALMEAYAHMLPYDGGTTGLDEAFGAGCELDRQSQSGSMSDTAWRNYRHFAQLTGIDFRSSTQLVFDVLQQMIEQNHILVLPNLVKFCEICESRDQIKWIKERTLRLQELIPMDDTISHEHIIYLLCRTQALLIPSHSELQHLVALIGNVYLKSSHCFIRIAALQGLLCLLECCSRTNTAIGKLSDELTLLRDLIVGYINRHGIIDESPLQFSDTHSKLVWTLNFSLIEWTSKFVPQCHLLSNTIIAASNILKNTHNEELYLCVLHGLERTVVNSSCANATPTSTEAIGRTAGRAAIGTALGTAGGGSEGGTVVTPHLRHKIEKLALELLKMENEKFSIPALKLLLSCMYVGSAAQLESTEQSNGIVQDDPEIIALQSDKVDILLHCIKSSSRNAAWTYGQVLCQIIRDLVPPNEILTKVIKEFLAINQPHCDVIATIVYQVFRSAIDSSFLQMLQDWLICTLPTFLAQPEQQSVWGLSIIFLSASINLHLIKLFPLVLGIGAASNEGVSTPASAASRKLGQHEIALFVTAAQDFHAKLSADQMLRFREAFRNYDKSQVYASMLQSL
ncbi:uncharacterized protein LOC6569724 [Drosophila grimshawi]|uniref:uncharacterized protein LOC6569724 n=1 Tax=Drosophila grimshawi TaxID=7222 RepID=UPI000C871354|nr:uncharacterized protein LOC6569724 [Drosophila grimshawi]